MVLRLKIAGKTYKRLSSLGASELQATQEFLARALREYLDRGSGQVSGRDPSPSTTPNTEACLKKIRFSEVEGVVPPRPGVYEIHTFTGVPLKVGISENLRKRLLRHRASRQSALKLNAGGQLCNPEDVRSKGSILAKHLYYDTTLVADYDLTLEARRRLFLEERCYFTFEHTSTKAEARELERFRERELPFRYIGRVQKR